VANSLRLRASASDRFLMNSLNHFPTDSYHTPPDTSRAWGDRLLLNSRLYFWVSFARIILRARRLVKQGKYDHAAWVNSSYAVLKLAEACGGRFHITGLDHVRAAGEAAVFVANHAGSLDAAVLPALIGSIRPLCFVVKQSLINYPLFGPVVQASQPIVVGRANPREDLQHVLQEGVARLTAGKSVVLFPESTRSAAFDPAQFNSLGAKLARKADVPLLPIALKTDFLGMGGLIRDLGPLHRERPIHIAFGPPIPVSGTGKIAHQQSVTFIADRLAAWHNGK
jgi:1-acyl-sn-glycerol-3-phosphate acyltransferase